MKFIKKTRTGNKIILSVLGIKFKHKVKGDTYIEDILKQWETDYDPQKLEKDIAEKIEKEEQKSHNREIYLVYASTLLENNNVVKAEHILRWYLEKYGCEDLYAFAPLCAFAEKLGLGNKQVLTVAKVFNALEKQRNSGSLQKYLKGKKIAIVGNSPNLQGKGLGAKIDGFDVVVRFNNYQTKGFEKDYGSKTDVWICCQANDIVNKPENELKKMSYILYNVDFPHVKLREKCLNNITENLQYDVPVSYIGAEHIKKLKSAGIVYPSTGLCGIYHIHHLQPLTRDNIFGFSFLENSSDYYQHYFSRRNKRTINRFLKNGHHHFDIESIFLQQFFRK